MKHFSLFILSMSLFCSQTSFGADKKSPFTEYLDRYINSLKADTQEVGDEFIKMCDSKTLITAALIIAIAYPIVEVSKDKGLSSATLKTLLPWLDFVMRAAIARLVWPAIFAASRLVKQPINALQALDKTQK